MRISEFHILKQVVLRLYHRNYHIFRNLKQNEMKIFTLILATICLLATSTTCVAQSSFLSLKNVESIEGIKASVAPSIKFSLLGIANGIVKVKMFNQPDGIYTVQLIDADGKIVGNKQIQHTSGTVLETTDFGKNLTGGTYQVEVVNPDNQKTTETIMLLI